MFILHCALILIAFGCGFGFHDQILAKLSAAKTKIMAKL